MTQRGGIMNIDIIKNEIIKINNYMKRCLWMDFEICQMSFIQIEIAGRLDTSINKYAISIEFIQPYFVSGLLCWEADNSKEFIELASQSEFAEISKKYQIGKEYYLFKISMEDYESAAVYVAASGIKCNIYEENPFG